MMMGSGVILSCWLKRLIKWIYGIFMFPAVLKMTMLKKEETFRYTDKFNSAQDAVTPAGVEVLLSSGTDTKIAASSDNHIYAYRIDATIRGEIYAQTERFDGNPDF